MAVTWNLSWTPGVPSPSCLEEFQVPRISGRRRSTVIGDHQGRVSTQTCSPGRMQDESLGGWTLKPVKLFVTLHAFRFDIVLTTYADKAVGSLPTSNRKKIRNLCLGLSVAYCPSPATWRDAFALSANLFDMLISIICLSMPISIIGMSVLK